MCLFLCQCHDVLITVAFQYSLKSGRVILPALFFFLKIALWLHMNFRIICSSSVKNVQGILIGIALNLQIALGSMAILTILILAIQGHGILFHFFELSSFSFVSVSQFSGYWSFTSLVKFISRGFSCCYFKWDFFFFFTFSF